MNEPPNIMTVDVEDYFHVRNFAAVIDPATWDSYRPAAPEATRRILDMLARRGATATFFVLGWMAERHPDLVKAIAQAGHEVASHGSRHEPVNTQTPAAFRADLRDSKRRLEDLVGRPVVGFRAPSFTIDVHSLWALDAMLEEGYAYDSSLFPGRRVPVGFLGVDRRPTRIERPGGTLHEFPLARLDVPGRSLPFSGGGFFRLAPYAAIRAGVRRVNRAHGAPVVVYFHPWELAPDQPRVAVPAMARFKHYVGLRSFGGKIERLLEDFSFVSIADYLRREAASGH